jgi:hypothetical protein
LLSAAINNSQQQKFQDTAKTQSTAAAGPSDTCTATSILLHCAGQQGSKQHLLMTVSSTSSFLLGSSMVQGRVSTLICSSSQYSTAQAQPSVNSDAVLTTQLPLQVVC